MLGRYVTGMGVWSELLSTAISTWGGIESAKSQADAAAAVQKAQVAAAQAQAAAAAQQQEMALEQKMASKAGTTKIVVTAIGGAVALGALFMVVRAVKKRKK